VVAGDLTAGSLAGDTTGQGDDAVGCTYSTPFGPFTLGEGAEDQVWRLVLPQTSGLTVTVTGYDSSAYLLQGDACATATLVEASCVDEGGGNTETMNVGSLAAGTYWLVVDGYANGVDPATSGAYTLDVAFPPPYCQRDEAEGPAGTAGNNTLATAFGPVRPLAADATLTLCPGDQDWLWFIHGGGEVRVTARPGPGVTGTLHADLVAVTRDAQGNPTGTAVPGTTYAAGVLSAPALPPGHYAVRVSGVDVDPTGIPYAFNVFMDCEPDAVELAHGLNNTLDTAIGPVLHQDTDLTLSVCPGDVDWFTLVHQGGALTVRAALPLGVTGTLTTELQHVTRDAGGVPTGSAVAGTTYANGRLQAPVLAPGEYAIRVAADAPPAGGLPYLFNVTWACARQDVLESRPNNTDVEASGPLTGTPVEPYALGLCPGDVDWFWVVNHGGASAVRVEVGGGAGLTVEPFRPLLDGAGAISGSTPSTEVVVTTEGADRVATHPSLGRGQGFLLRVSAAAMPPEGLAYTLRPVLPPPANDTCQTYDVLGIPSPGEPPLVVRGTTAGAGDDLLSDDPDACGGDRGAAPPDVVYAFMVPQAMRLTARVEGFDSIAYLRRDDCETGEEVACNDDENYDAGRLGSLLDQVPMQAGEVYFLVVDSYGQGGAFTLTLSAEGPEGCTEARPATLGASSSNTTGRRDDFQGCTWDDGQDGYVVVGLGAEDEVYRLDVAETSGLQVDLTGFDAALYLMRGPTCQTATLMTSTCTDRAGTTESLSVGALEPGTYWLVVDGYDDGSNPPTAGPYNLTVALTAPYCDPDGGEGATGNNTLATAFGPLAAMTGEAVLSLCPADEDWFLILNGGGDLSVTARPVPGAGGTLTAELLSVDRSGAVPVGTPVPGGVYAGGVVTASSLPSAEYAVRIRGDSIPVAGIPYRFTFWRACSPNAVEERYGLAETLDTAVGPLASQDNDLNLGLCPFDTDWFTMVHRGGGMTVTAGLAPAAPGTLTPRLHAVDRDPDGVPTPTEVTAVPYSSGSFTAASLPPGEYAVEVVGTGLPAAGTTYLLNVRWTCTARDDLEAAPNNLDTQATGPMSATPPTPHQAALCPDDVDWLWFTNLGAPGVVQVRLGGAAGLAVEAFLPTLDGPSRITGSAPTALVDVTTSGGDVLATYAAAPTGSSFLLRVAAGAEAIPATGRSYTVTGTFTGPANDTCDTATVLTLPPVGSTLELRGTTVGTADNYNSPSAACAGHPTAVKPEVVYAFVVETATRVSVRTTGYDTVIYLRRTACASGAAGDQVACNDDENYGAGLYGSYLGNLYLTPATYYLFVDSYQNPGPFTLTLSTAAP
jgi:hypothetical protein